MSVPPLRLYNNFEPFFSGEVIVHASAVIAPGVIMQAAPNSKIIIGSGVCIGMGSILQVDAGILEIESGANLGAGFLMVGAGKIGVNACIGSATTVFRASVEAGKVVPAGSVIGDNSRSLNESSTEEMNGKFKQTQLPLTEQVEEEISSHIPNSPTYVTPPLTPSPRPYVSPSPISYFSPVKNSTEEKAVSSDAAAESAEQPTNVNSNGVGNHIYGRTNIKSLLITLFPHRQSLDTPVSEEQQSEDG